MSKITFENKKGKITIINRLSYPETVNERVYNAIASGMFEGLLPVSIRQRRKETRIECVVQGLIPLAQYFDGITTKKMFLDFVHEIALLIKNCEKNMINPNNLDLQNDKIFIDPQTKSVKCIFWPVVNNQRGNPPHLFLKQLPFELNFNPHEDLDYLETYKAFFDGVHPFSVNTFDKVVLKLLGKKSSGGHTTPSEALAGATGANAKPEKKETEAQKKINIEYDPFANQSEYTEKMKKESVIRHDANDVFCSLCGERNRATSNFCLRCGNRLKEEATVPEKKPKSDQTVDFGTMVLGDDSGGTTVLGYDEPMEPVYPTLTRLRTKESFSVDKPSFRIGTEQSYCDLFICDNNYISRSHADIVTREDRYYIIDRNSTNRTFVDGKVIPAEKEVEIFAGTQIRLANEDFSFDIES